MNIERTYDAEFITRCMTVDWVWDMMTDDGCGSRELFFPPIHDGIIWLRAEDCGVFMLHPHNHVTWEVHTCLPFAGKRTLEAAIAGRTWMFENTPCMRIITNVPTFNRAALAFAKRAGMKEYGVNEKSFLKNGVLYDQILLGISKEAACQQSQ